MAESIKTEALAEMICSEKGQKFKALYVAWDENESKGHAEVVAINRGRGMETSIAVRNTLGTMFYIGPFGLEQCPSGTKLLMFECTGQFFVKAEEKIN